MNPAPRFFYELRGTWSLPPLQNPVRHSHLAVIQQHAVHLLDGAVGGVLSLKVDEGVALGAVFIAHHLQRKGRQTRGDQRSEATSEPRCTSLDKHSLKHESLPSSA